ncbi:MAG: hypothetical protein ACUVYA_17545, partial [Planctomycetota bacterium]
GFVPCPTARNLSHETVFFELFLSPLMNRTGSMEDYVSSDVEVRSLEEQLKLIFEDFERLGQAFSPERAPKTLALVEEVVKESARRTVERLRKLGAAGVRLPPERKPGPKDGTPS